MIKQMNGWKVVYNGASCGNAMNPGRLYYDVGKIVRPTIARSLIFFFKEREDANGFINNTFLGFLVTGQSHVLLLIVNK